MEEKINKMLQERRILSTKGTVKNGKEFAYARVQKLINLHPNDSVWVEGVASTAFTPNTQNASFIDVAQERGIVDDDYIPIDDEVYEDIRERWDGTVYEAFPRKTVEAVFDKGDDSERERMKFFNDDSECW